MPSIVDKCSAKKVCVDDFALRKRFTYGTVMVNLESHRIIDMIPSRETAEVSKWLATEYSGASEPPNPIQRATLSDTESHRD